MKLDLNEKEQKIIRHALEDYLPNLREEIVKTEKHDWKAGLHEEEDVLKEEEDVLKKVITTLA